ncbi:hypothetical protein BCR37DRAFT_267542 [Protomyces lactucae-debilis]|uniref:Uncharacterized protein n=1 Tax=Protomyces lactucae-debilis TaxID=2754530 RepID=A0A1Y2FKG8_PROLT|nr:uncharacterized protein BCR37DRAFT_267542 [Protomyces lactucae-debilis]ORY84448.1 hypothetical protein BCR37DRAFT_267542 [Protomyces lactucae-debilis]
MSSRRSATHTAGATSSSRQPPTSMAGPSTTTETGSHGTSPRRTQPLAMKHGARTKVEDNHGSPASTATATPTTTTSTTMRNDRSTGVRYASSADFLSPTMRSSYKSETFDLSMSHDGYGYHVGGMSPSPVIVTSKATGFAWNRDVFLSRWGQERAGLEEDYGSAPGHGQRVEAHEIILDDEDLMFGV